MALFTDPGFFVAMTWLAILFVIALTMRPYLPTQHFHIWDNGFGLSLGLGTGLSFLGAWFVAAVGLWPFDSVVAYGSLALLAVFPAILNAFGHMDYVGWGKEEILRFLLGFGFFCIIFWGAFWVIGFNPLVDSITENYMDYGFIQAIYQWKKVPPEDIWFSQTSLQYYYLGQAAVVYLCRLAQTTPEYGYNLMLCTIIAALFMMVWELVYGMVLQLSHGASKVISHIAGLVGGMAVCFSSNGHWVVFGVLHSIYQRVCNNRAMGYFFSESISYISTEYGDADVGRTEFPMYSIVLGDLHAHVINLLFVVPFLFLLLDYGCCEDEKKSRKNMLLCGLLLGLFQGANYWDYVIYLVIGLGVILFANWKNWKAMLVDICLIVGISTGVSMPFTLQFHKMASQLCLAENHSPVFKLLILWLMPCLFAAGLLLEVLIQEKKEKHISHRLGRTIIAVILCAFGLILTPEILYIKDIYGIEYARFNTMFKLTYQAFLLLGIFTGIAFGVWLNAAVLRDEKKGSRPVMGACIYIAGSGLILLYTFMGALYAPNAIADWFGDVSPEQGGNRVGISATAGLYYNEETQFDKRMADYILANSDEHVRLVEVAGESYAHGDLVSVLCGASTVVGWRIHEWLWQDNQTAVEERYAEVRQFYESGSADYCRAFLKKYDVDFIVVGTAEWEKYEIDFGGFLELGEIVLEEDYYGERLLLLACKG